MLSDSFNHALKFVDLYAVGVEICKEDLEQSCVAQQLRMSGDVWPWVLSWFIHFWSKLALCSMATWCGQDNRWLLVLGDDWQHHTGHACDCSWFCLCKTWWVVSQPWINLDVVACCSNFKLWMLVCMMAQLMWSIMKLLSDVYVSHIPQGQFCGGDRWQFLLGE